MMSLWNKLLVGYYLICQLKTTAAQLATGTVMTGETTASNQDYTTIELLRSTCPGEICVNGEDINGCITDYRNCTCEVNDITFFKGDLCEYVIFNEAILNVSTTARTGVFTWPSPPNIREDQYTFVYTSNGRTEGGSFLALSTFDENEEVILSQNFSMIDDVRARIIELYSGKVNYTVCVMNNSWALRVVEEQDFEAVSTQWDNCLILVTKDSVLWGYSLAAYIIGGLMIVVVFGLIVMKPCIDNYQNKKKYVKMSKEEDPEEDSVSGESRNEKDQDGHQSDKNLIYEKIPGEIGSDGDNVEAFDIKSYTSMASTYSAPISDYGGSINGRQNIGYADYLDFDEPEADY